MMGYAMVLALVAAGDGQAHPLRSRRRSSPAPGTTGHIRPGAGAENASPKLSGVCRGVDRDPSPPVLVAHRWI